ncbi:hypothetical protein ACUXV3_01905 [Roseobacteraceae bacterium NS-SX3]
MSVNWLTHFRAAGLALACGGGLLPQTGAAEGRWSFILAPQFLAQTLEGTADLGIAAGPLSVDPGDIIDSLEEGGLLHFEGRHESNFGFMLGASYMNFDDSSATPAGQIHADIGQRVVEAVATYRFGDADSSLDAYAGLRHWDVDTEVTVTGGPGAGRAERRGSWTDPIVGLRWQRRLSNKFRLSLQGDIGGFGAGAEETWSVTGGLIYRRWPRASIYMMYRALGVEYRDGARGTPSFFEYDTVTHGLMAGIGFQF